MNDRNLGRIFHVSLEGRGVEENASFLRKVRPGSISLYANDFSNLDELRKLIGDITRFYRTELAMEKPLIAIDQEGGRVLRTRDIPNSPGNMAIGATGDSLMSEYAGKLMGYQLRTLGIDWDLAPVLDVNRNPRNPIIGTRSFGDNVAGVSSLGVHFIRGMKSQGCLTTAKHFPGHGSVDVDSHLDLPVDRSSLARIKEDAIPFAEALKEGVDTVMISHLSYPSMTGRDDLPATLSKGIVTDYLKKELSCAAPVMTDSLSMGAVKKHFSPSETALKAIEAGIDMLALTERSAAIEMFDSLLGQSGNIEKRLEDALHRVSPLYVRKDIGKPVPTDTLNHLIYSSVTRMGPHARPAGATDTLWRIYDFKVTVAGRSYSPLEEALKRLDIHFTRQGEGNHALVQVSDDHVWPHHKLDEIIGRHKEVYAIGIGTPYDSGLLPGIPYYTGYSPDVQSVIAALEALFGLFEPRGKLPVTVPANRQ